VNDRSKYVLMLTNINSIYSNNNTNPQLFSQGDYGIINLEDNFVDYVSLFYCSEVSDNSVTLISIELQINSVVLPSVDIRGDLRIKGDTYFHNNDTNVDFVSIDTNESFFGVGTNERYVNYSNNNILTTTNNDLARQHFIVSGDTYPVAITERIAEIKPDRDPITNEIKDYPDDLTTLFGPVIGMTSRRKSNYYTLSEMKEYAEKNYDIAISGPYPGKTIQYDYGISYGFEIQDSTQITRNIGGIQMYIDDIDETKKNIKAGFKITVLDTDPVEGYAVARDTLVLNNNGVLNVDKITLGMDPLETNNVSLSGKNNDLLINGEALVKQSAMYSLFSNDAEGNLIITYNGKQYKFAPI